MTFVLFTEITEFGTAFLEKSLDVENCLSLWIFATRYVLNSLSEKCLTFFLSNLMSVANTSEFKLMENEFFLDVMEQIKHSVSSGAKMRLQLYI